MKIEHPQASQISGLRHLWQEAFGDPDAFLDSFFAHGFGPERCLCVTDGDTVAGALYWFSCRCEGRRLAYLYALAVKKSHRRRGLARALVEKSVDILKAQGCSGILLVPGEPELFEMYRRMDFRQTLTADTFTAIAGVAPAALRLLDGDTYGALRSAFLPEDSVVQEDENLRFLASASRLYGGDGFLAAGNMEGDTFSAMEFLGDRAAVPGFLAAIGAKTGTFRTPGQTLPFALYRSLDTSPAPTYFGLAFD